MFNCSSFVTSCVVIKCRVVIPYFYYRSSFMILSCLFIFFYYRFLFIILLSCFIYHICRVLVVVLSFYFFLFWSMLFFWPIFHVGPKAHLTLFAGPSPAQLQGPIPAFFFGAHFVSNFRHKQAHGNVPAHCQASSSLGWPNEACSLLLLHTPMRTAMRSHQPSNVFLLSFSSCMTVMQSGSSLPVKHAPSSHTRPSLRMAYGPCALAFPTSCCSAFNLANTHHARHTRFFHSPKDLAHICRTQLTHEAPAANPLACQRPVTIVYIATVPYNSLLEHLKDARTAATSGSITSPVW